jgi:hypothetical protein
MNNREKTTHQHPMYIIIIPGLHHPKEVPDVWFNERHLRPQSIKRFDRKWQKKNCRYIHPANNQLPCEIPVSNNYETKTHITVFKCAVIIGRKWHETIKKMLNENYFLPTNE